MYLLHIFDQFNMTSLNKSIHFDPKVLDVRVTLKSNLVTCIKFDMSDDWS